MSYKQAQQRGWQVRRGEIGTQIEYWEFPSASREREQRGSQPDSDQGDKTAPRMIHRIYTVFNAKQIDGIPPYTPKQRAELASLFLAAERAIPHNPASHVAYVGSWLQALRPVCKLSRTSNSYSLDSAPPPPRSPPAQGLLAPAAGCPIASSGERQRSASRIFHRITLRIKRAQPHRIHQRQRIVPHICIRIPRLRIQQIRSQIHWVRTRKPSHSRSIIPRRKKVHPSLAISDLAGELLLHAVACPKQQARGAPRIARRNLFPKRQIILPRHHVPTPIRQHPHTAQMIKAHITGRAGRLRHCPILRIWQPKLPSFLHGIAISGTKIRIQQPP